MDSSSSEKSTMDTSISEKSMDEEKRFPFFHPFSRRFHLVLMLMFLLYCSNWMRGNLGMTMTCMVNTTAVSIHSDSSKKLHNGTKFYAATKCHARADDSGDEESFVNDYGGTIIWNSQVQNLLFSGTFWGALFTTLPAGYFADRTSPSNMIQLSMLIFIITTALFPYLAMYTTYQVVFFSRLLMGLGEGFLIPAINAIITKWLPNHEKSTSAAIFTSGNQLSGIFGLPIAAAFCASDWKWPAVFYTAALLGTIWLIVWRATVKNSPHKTSLITDKEKAYLERVVEMNRPHRKDYPTPWKSIFTSLPFYCCFLCGFSGMMVMVVLQIYLPTFFKEVLFLKVVDNGFYSAAPFIVQFSVKLIWSIFLDNLRGKYISNTASCKISQGLSTIIIVLFLILMGHLPDCKNPGIAVLLVCGMACGFGVSINGFYASLLSIAPSYTGVLSSIHMVLGFLGMLATPQLVSVFRVYGTLEEWRTIFYIIASCVLVTGIFFCIFAEAEVQPWAKFDGSEKNSHNLLNEKESFNDLESWNVKEKTGVPS